MGLDVVATVVAAGVGAVALTRWSTHRNAHRLTNALAKDLDMEVRQRTWFGPPNLFGRIRDLEVTITSPLMNYLAVEIRLPRAIPAGGWISRRTTPPGPLLPSGDDELDRRFSSGGEPRAIAAMLHDEARRSLRASSVERLSVMHDRIVVDGFWVPLYPRRLPELVAQLRSAIEIAYALPFEGTAAERVAENAELDPNPSVRLRNLILVRGEQTARMALADRDPVLRVVGAAYLSAFDEIRESDAVEALESTADRTVLEAALAAMAAIGTQRSIQAIRRNRRRVRALSRMWRDTVAAIQERLGSDGEGDLSLLEEISGGDVSLTDWGLTYRFAVAVRKLHGVEIVVPDAWEDHSLYRFATPRGPDAPKLALKQADRLHANLMVSRRLLEKEQSLRTLMQSMNDEVKAAAPTFRALAGGEGEYRGRRMLWQDSSMLHEPSKRPVFQRHVLIPDDRGTEVVMLVLTGEKSDIQKMSGEMSLEI